MTSKKLTATRFAVGTSLLVAGAGIAAIGYHDVAKSFMLLRTEGHTYSLPHAAFEAIWTGFKTGAATGFVAVAVIGGITIKEGIVDMLRRGL
jgi:hypothetical protein